MTTIYLWLNAALYALFALWCTLSPLRTAQNIGFLELSPGGSSEYLVVYGGMELGLAFFFAWCARNGLERTGLVFALALYLPIVAYRIVSVARHWPVGSTTLAVAGLEIALLLAAVALWFFAHPANS
jgi:hypothetical protein